MPLCCECDRARVERHGGVCVSCRLSQKLRTIFAQEERITTLEAKLAQREAEVEQLRWVANELIEVAELRGDNALPLPEDDPLLWTARMQTAWNELEEALTPTANEEKKDE